MRIKHDLRRLFRKLGYDISRFTPASHPLARARRLFEDYSIDTVLDIGANSGQFAGYLRENGFAGHILSFEPLSAAYRLLEANAKNDPAWDVFNYALGDTAETREINIAGNCFSSSLLDMLPSHIKAAPESVYVDKEFVEVKTLDEVFDVLCNSASNIYMKIDTQGFEKNVLKGAEESLSSIDTIRMELSLSPLYDGEILFHEMYSLMEDKGYILVALESGFCDPISGQVLQVDGTWHRPAVNSLR